MSNNWTSGQCVFYVPLEDANHFDLLVQALSADAMDDIFKEPGESETLLGYEFEIDDLVRRATTRAEDFVSPNIILSVFVRIV